MMIIVTIIIVIFITIVTVIVRINSRRIWSLGSLMDTSTSATWPILKQLSLLQQGKFQLEKESQLCSVKCYGL